MEKILILAHSDPGGTVSKHALETVQAAKELADSLADASLAVGTIGEDAAAAANAIASIGAASRFVVEGADFTQPRYVTDAAAAEAVCKAAEATIVLVPATSRWNRVAAGLAARLGGRADTHVTNLSVEEGAPTANRWYYRKRMEARFARTQRPWVIALESGCCPPADAQPGDAEAQAIDVALAAADIRTEVTGIEAPAADEQTIRPDADVLFVAGAGWTKKQADGEIHAAEAEALIMGFLNTTQSSLGSSKSLVDLASEGQKVLPFMSHMNQIGQTGATPRHPKGLSTCCHGEEPHTIGWRFIDERRAISLDPNCGWAQGKADVLYVADAFEVMAKVNEILKEG